MQIIGLTVLGTIEGVVYCTVGYNKWKAEQPKE